MPISINNNLMPLGVSNNLESHYARLSVSVQRLSSGLRINSAADDAAGLAIRELMRADVTALNQGMRNASDAISMIQVADGALGVIDEKLIRMKELAEQAATGTYSSTQRLIIDSEYQAMAAEIDRIARATDFNGIKLLDGSLTGAHNGAGLNSTGALKIHFGSGNDSDEDYYYVSIGDCTTAGLGLGAAGGMPAYEKEVTTQTTGAVFMPQTEYELYENDAGTQYYKVGDMYCWDYKDPLRTMLHDADTISQLRKKPKTERSEINYYVYNDPNTGAEYYGLLNLGRQPSFTSDPYDPIGKRLDTSKPADKAIADRLQNTPGKTLKVVIRWDVWSAPDGTEYYTYDKGSTFVPNKSAPLSNVLDSANPADAAIIEGFTPVYGTAAAPLPDVRVYYTHWRDRATGSLYYSPDGGKTFQKHWTDPASTLDPVADKDLIARMVKDVKVTFYGLSYNSWYDPVTRKNWYTNDNQTWWLRPATPGDASLVLGTPADDVIIARLQPVRDNITAQTTCSVYQDTANNNKLYYSRDNGKSFFSDVADPAGSEFSATDPAYASLVANFNKISSTLTIKETFTAYYDKVTMTKYYSRDNGKSFCLDYTNPVNFLDPAKPGDLAIIGRLEFYPQDKVHNTPFYIFTDPDTGKSYYSSDRAGSQIYDDPSGSRRLLDPSDPADRAILDRLVGSQPVTHTRQPLSQHEEVTAYTDGNRYYYSHDGGKTFTRNAQNTFADPLDPNKPDEKAIIDALKPASVTLTKVEYIPTGGTVGGAGATISTQEAAQKALEAIDRAIVSKDQVRANLGATQNRLENTVTNLTIMAENMLSAESRISDADIGAEMMVFVRNQILTQSSVAMLSQANTWPHMLMNLIGG